MNNKVAITAVGHYIPTRKMTNEELSKKYSITEDYILEKTGIEERRYAAEDQNTSDLVCLAIKDLLSKSDKTIDQIECIIVGTLSPDYFFPSTAVNVINKLKAKNAWGFDLSAACSGFCYGISVASDMIKSQTVKNVIVVGAERMSKTLNAFDYKTAVLCGDGAGAVLLENKAENYPNTLNGKLCKVKADNLEVENVYFKTPFNSLDWSQEKFELNGGVVYRNGVSHMSTSITEYLLNNKLTLDDFKHIVPHQSNLNMLKDVAFQLQKEISFFKINIDRRGNTGAATIPICLSECSNSKTIVRGDRILMVSFGAGYTISIVDITIDF